MEKVITYLCRTNSQCRYNLPLFRVGDLVQDVAEKLYLSLCTADGSFAFLSFCECLHAPTHFSTCCLVLEPCFGWVPHRALLHCHSFAFVASRLHLSVPHACPSGVSHRSKPLCPPAPIPIHLKVLVTISTPSPPYIDSNNLSAVINGDEVRPEHSVSILFT